MGTGVDLSPRQRHPHAVDDFGEIADFAVLILDVPAVELIVRVQPLRETRVARHLGDHVVQKAKRRLLQQVLRQLFCFVSHKVLVFFFVFGVLLFFVACCVCRRVVEDERECRGVCGKLVVLCDGRRAVGVSSSTDT